MERELGRQDLTASYSEIHGRNADFIQDGGRGFLVNILFFPPIFLQTVLFINGGIFIYPTTPGYAIASNSPILFQSQLMENSGKSIKQKIQIRVLWWGCRTKYNDYGGMASSG